MAVDAGATRSEIDALGARFGAAAAIVPRETTADERDAGRLRVGGGSGRAPRLSRRRDVEADVGIDRPAAGNLHHRIAARRRFASNRQRHGLRAHGHAAGRDPVIARVRIQRPASCRCCCRARRSCCANPSSRSSWRRTRARSTCAGFRACRSCSSICCSIRRKNRGRPACNGSSLRARRSARPWREPFMQRFGVKVHAFYGTTEGGGITYDDSDDPAIADTVGRPIDGVTVSLRPEADVPGGRVHIRSAGVSAGYVGADQGDFQDDGFLAGDYGTMDADGRLTLGGRVSSFINVAGRKVQPAEVEAVLREMPAVIDVRVVGARDDRARRTRRRLPGASPRQCAVDDDRGPAVLRQPAGVAQDSARRGLRRRDSADTARQDGSCGARRADSIAHDRRSIVGVLYSGAISTTTADRSLFSAARRRG